MSARKLWADASAFFPHEQDMRIIVLSVLVACSVPVAATSPIQTVVSAIDEADASAALPVELIFLNTGKSQAVHPTPARIPAELLMGGRRVGVTLERSPETAATMSIAAGKFSRARYVLRRAALDGSTSAILSLPGVSAGGYAFNLPATAASPPVAVARQETRLTSLAVSKAPPSAEARAGASDATVEGGTGNAFLANLSAYEPIYAVYGPGTNTDAKLQISFKYQLFGEGGAIGGERSWLDGIHFAFTQRLFWDLGRESSPFRNVDYRPEVFYLLPGRPVTGRVSAGGQAGLLHESNGREGLASRSLNTLYVQPVASLPVGSYRLTAGPRLLAYVGSLEDNPDIKRYRGNTGLFAELTRDDGLRISTTSRLNFGTGKGAINTEASYPLNRLVAPNLNLYVFGQAFVGYGENLLDYDRRTTRLRIGIGIIR